MFTNVTSLLSKCCNAAGSLSPLFWTISPPAFHLHQLIFTIMTPVHNQFISPTAHTQLCAQTQRTIFTTFFHTAWHGGPNSNFKFIDRGAEEVVGNGDSRSTTEGDGAEEGEEHLAMETEDVVDSIPFPRFQQTGPPPLAAVDGDDDDDNDSWDNAGVGSGHNVSKDDKEGESSDSGDESEFELLEERQGNDKNRSCSRGVQYMADKLFWKSYGYRLSKRAKSSLGL